MSTILALDLSTRAGWAMGGGDTPPRHGVVVLPDGQRSIGASCCGLLDWLGDMFNVTTPDLVVMEAPLPPGAQTNATTARLQLALAGAVETICWRWDIPCREAPAPTVRKVVMGRGTGVTKDDVVAWARGQGYAPQDHNAADALALLTYAQRTIPVAA